MVHDVIGCMAIYLTRQLRSDSLNWISGYYQKGKYRSVSSVVERIEIKHNDEISGVIVASAGSFC